MEEYIGAISHFAFDYSPANFVRCDGSALWVNQYSALFALVGTMYGGDGITRFAVPDLRGKSPLDKSPTDCHYYICAFGVWPDRP